MLYYVQILYMYIYSTGFQYRLQVLFRFVLEKNGLAVYTIELDKFVKNDRDNIIRSVKTQQILN